MKEMKLTERQRRAYDFIRGYISANGEGPSQKELSCHLAMHQGNITRLLESLEKRNLICYERYVTRGIKLNKETICL